MEETIREVITEYKHVQRYNFPHLRYRNVKEIAYQVDEDKVRELVSQKNECTVKLYELLNDAIKEDEYIDEDEDDQSDVDLILTPYICLDPRVITNRHLSETVLEGVLKATSTRAKIAKLISDQQEFINDIKEKRKEIENDPEKVKDFDKMCMIKCKQYEKSATRVLARMKMPYFALRSDYKYYPEYEDDKAWILDRLKEELTEKT